MKKEDYDIDKLTEKLRQIAPNIIDCKIKLLFNEFGKGKFKYFAFDRNGSGFLYTQKPELNEMAWCYSGEATYLMCENNCDNWKESLICFDDYKKSKHLPYIMNVLKFGQELQKLHSKKLNEALTKGCKWIAIDKDGSVNAFVMKPYFEEGDIEWYCNHFDDEDFFHICTIETTYENWKESLLQIAPENKPERNTKKVCIEDTNSISDDLGGKINSITFTHHIRSDYADHTYRIVLLNGEVREGNVGDTVEVVIEDGEVIEIIR